MVSKSIFITTIEVSPAIRCKFLQRSKKLYTTIGFKKRGGCATITVLPPKKTLSAFETLTALNVLGSFSFGEGQG